MRRRDFLLTAATLPLAAKLEGSGKVYQTGWIPSKKSSDDFIKSHTKPYFSQNCKSISGTGDGKKALLWKFYESATGNNLVPHKQTDSDCVSHGWGLGIDIVDAIQITHGNGKWVNKVATEIIYAGGRVEIAGGRYRGGGMNGFDAARWCENYGVLLRQPYLDGKYDFTHYNGTKARKWAHNCSGRNACTTWGGGVPNELEPLCKEHPVRTTTLITTWSQAKDALYNGYPIAICSNYGFTDKRDKDGFARQQGTWYHCMLLAGYDDTNRRPGGLIINSWGANWIDGPTRLGQPSGSFWVDADVLHRMLLQGDSFAISNYVGYPRQHLDYKLY